MLPTAHRMRRSEDFALAVRRGRRSGSAHLVAHLLLPGPAEVTADPMIATDHVPTSSHQHARCARVGFVVSKAVGGAVVRNTVKRRLRALVAERLDRLPAGSLLVVRANPAASGAASGDLGSDLDRTLDRLLAANRPSS